MSFAAARSPIICSSSGVQGREASAIFEPLFITVPVHPPNCASAEVARRTRAKAAVKIVFIVIPPEPGSPLAGFQLAIVDKSLGFFGIRLDAGHELGDAFVIARRRLVKLGRV